MTPAEFRALHGDPRTDVRHDMFGDVQGWSAEEFDEYEHVAEYASWMAKRSDAPAPTASDTTGGTR
ncbi:hypothetical protein ACFRCG_42655 [Embleya sp. NPDC056575]|uniref:hypothetical protein n=1 Tax=unclassified Embleya TaxID=2699296 RepID=UPI0036D01FF5